MLNDDLMLKLLVGEVVFERGLGYARDERVLEAHWTAEGVAAKGRVEGSGDQVYEVALQLGRSLGGKITDFSSFCDCPVMRNCKHAVALWLALSHAEYRPAEGRSSTPSWMRDLEDLAAVPTPTEPPLLAPLFEIARHPVGGAGLRMMLAGRGPAGWTTTGMHWFQLRERSHTLAVEREDPTRRALLEDLVACVRRDESRMDSVEDDVWLDRHAHLRFWSVVRELAEAGVPLLARLRPLTLVNLFEEPADAVIEVARDDDGVLVRPAIRHGLAMPTTTHVLLGEPVHGVAWRDEQRELYLAPFRAPLATNLANVVRRGPVRVPASGVQRLLHEVIPSWPASIPVESTDPSLVLAPRARGVVVLALTYADDVLVANWRRGLDGLTWRAPLDTAAHAVHDPDTAALLERVRHVLAGTPAVTAGERVELRNPLALEGLAAAHFVTRTLPLLEEIDGLLVEREGDWPTFREAVASPVITLGGAASDGGDWFDLDVQVTVEGESVPFQTLFTALARGVSHVILPSGTYFALAGGEWGRLRDLIVEARSLSTSRDRTTVSRYQVALWKDLFALGEADERASAWRDALAGLVDDDPEPVEAPASLQATLRPYQLEGLGWLSRLYEAGLGGILADDMGLGKTVQALALVCHADERYRETRPFLVVAPTSVVGNWARECARFAPHLRCTTMVQTAAKSGVALADVVASHDIIITSYNLLRLDATSYQAIDWAGLFLDEAQFAKNHRTLAHETVRGLNVAFKVAMTGTPIENNLTELWALTNIVAPGLFPHVDQFEHYYRTPIERFGDTERLELLRKRLRPFLLRRTKEEVATDLPPKQEQVLSLELEPEHRRAYDTLLAHERQKVLGLLDDLDGNRFEILSSLTRLRQASLDVGLVSEDYAEIPSTKLNALMELLEDVAGDHRVLIFSQFTSFLKRAAERVAAAGLAYCYLDGATTNRQDVIDRFRDGDAPVFLISLKAGGFGLNLTEADYCVMLDPWWNPAAEEQAIDRTHRIGQTRTVMVYRMVGVNTIEEKVMAMKDAKSALFDSVLGDGEYSRASLSAADIRSLLS